MNEFDNFPMRGIDLPPGCKDLNDVLQLRRRPRRYELPAAPVEGFVDIERYLSKLVQSSAKRRSVMIFSVENWEHVNISHRAGTLRLTVTLNTNDPAYEKGVLAMFGDAGILPKADCDGRVDGVPLRLLVYPLPASVPEAAELIRIFFRKVHGLADSAGLEFLYHERDV